MDKTLLKFLIAVNLIVIALIFIIFLNVKVDEIDDNLDYNCIDVCASKELTLESETRRIYCACIYDNTSVQSRGS